MESKAAEAGAESEWEVEIQLGSLVQVALPNSPLTEDWPIKEHNISTKPTHGHLFAPRASSGVNQATSLCVTTAANYGYLLLCLSLARSLDARPGTWVMYICEQREMRVCCWFEQLLPKHLCNTLCNTSASSKTLKETSPSSSSSCFRASVEKLVC